jgi:hypothetical protein
MCAAHAEGEVAVGVRFGAGGFYRLPGSRRENRRRFAVPSGMGRRGLSLTPVKVLSADGQTEQRNSPNHVGQISSCWQGKICAGDFHGNLCVAGFCSGHGIGGAGLRFGLSQARRVSFSISITLVGPLL